MISIQDWFDKNAKLPLILISAFVVLITGCFFLYLIYQNNQVRNKSANNLFTVANHALEKNYRPILETTFSVAFEELEAKKILLCDEKITIMSYPVGVSGCDKEQSGSLLVDLIIIPAIGRPQMKFYFYVPKVKLSPSYFIFLFVMLIFIVAIYALLFKIYRKFTNDILNPLGKNLLADEPINIIQFEDMRKKIRESQKIREENAIIDAIIEHNIVIRHNANSILQTLNELLLSFDLENISKLKKEIMESVIEGMRKLLLKLNTGKEKEKGYQKRSNDSTMNKYVGPTNLQKSLVSINQLLKTCIDSKKVEYRSSVKGFKINLLLDKEIDKSFVNIVDDEMRGIISNIINNSVDAFDKTEKKIRIKSSQRDKKVIITIFDTGKGLPQELVEKIFLRNFSYEKPQGTGYGLYHAKTFIESWGGTIKLVKTSSKGTMIEIQLPLWEAPKIILQPDSEIIIVDDDKTIHDRWNEKIETFSKRNQLEIKIHNFYTFKNFCNWFNEAQFDYSKVLFLVDYHIEDDNLKGVEIIDNLGISELSWLVTNSYDEKSVVDVCDSAQIKILPKVGISLVEFC